MVKFTAL